MQAIPNVIGKITLIGDIGKGAGETLSQLSKTDASKVINIIIDSSTDSTGKIIKNTDEIIESIIDEAEAISKQIEYDNTDEIIDIVNKSSSEGSAFVAKAAVDSSDLIGYSGKFIDDLLESDYQKYCAKKIKNGKTPKSRLEWKQAREYWLNDSPMARGNAFNKLAREKYLVNELYLANG